MISNRLLPTPSAACGIGGQKSRSGKRKGELLLAGAIQNLLPTPRANDPEKRGNISNDPRNGLPGVVQNTLPELIFSLGAHPVSQLRMQGKDRARQMLDGSGRRLLQRWKLCKAGGSFSRIRLVSCLLLEDWSSRRCAHVWRERVIGSRVLLSLHVRSVRPIDGIGCGLLQTPLPSDVDGGRTTKGSKRQTETGIRAQLLRTPAAADALRGVHPHPDKKAGQHSLVTQLGMLPTPTSRDHRSEKCSQKMAEKNSRPLSETLGTNTGMKLQPAFVEWLMGFPEGWTELEAYPANPRHKGKQPVGSTD